MANVYARSLPLVPYKRMCDLKAPGHNQIIMPNKPAYQITSGIAQGIYHNSRCYDVARRHYEKLKAQLNLK